MALACYHYGTEGLTRLNVESAVPEILPLLSDPSPCVVREVSQSLSRASYLVAGDELMEIALHAPGRFARSHAVRTIARLGKWRSLPWLLSIAAISESDVAVVAEEELLLWLTPPKCNKVFTSPTPPEREALNSVLEKAQGHASERTLILVRSTLQQFS
ncbi:HEAT repeat domain-containing protein [Planctomicrobium sp. SH527]|uniref:HEAT repeat domain-containing protein n=1 Tax=Planctomicrobium sp. SH527 TaxID=3448123 RepID=UPI003F5B6072